MKISIQREEVNPDDTSHPCYDHVQEMKNHPERFEWETMGDELFATEEEAHKALEQHVISLTKKIARQQMKLGVQAGSLTLGGYLDKVTTPEGVFWVVKLAKPR